MAEPADSRTKRETPKGRRFLPGRRARSGEPASSKTFEGSSIEDALMAAAQEFGPGVEVMDARRCRRGGVFGFFAREGFEVTAGSSEPGSAMSPHGVNEQSLDDADTPNQERAFDKVLAQMADGVVDTVEFDKAAEQAVEPVAEPAPRLPPRPRTPARTAPLPARPAPSGFGGRSALADRAVGLIDLRQGRRIPVDSMGGSDLRERPSQLRRRLTAGDVGPLGTNPLTREVPGSVVDLRDSRPEWSVERLTRLGLDDRVLDLVAAFEPTSDLEWVQALATAIQVLMPDEVSGEDTLLAGEGRASAVGLVQALASGKIPAFLLIDGQQIPATADELALSIRECLR